MANNSKLGSYNGESKDGWGAHGYGTMKYSGGGEYNGDWKDGEKHGKGKMKYDNGDEYDGDWKDGKRDGQGKFIGTSGYTYEGHYENGEKVKGKEKWPKGTMYDGEFKKGKRNGNGIYKFTDGKKYEGNFKNGLLHGKGKMTDLKGNVSEGNWKDNKKRDYFVLTDASGNKYKQIYDEGTLTLSKRFVTLESIDLIDGNPSKRLRVGGETAVGVLVLGRRDIECSICMENFSTDTSTIDEQVKNLLPVLGSCNCTSVYCRGCVLKQPKVKVADGEEWVKCPGCGENSFRPSDLKNDLRLIDYLNRYVPVAKDGSN